MTQLLVGTKKGLFVLEGEPFFGQDRIDVLLWRMKQKGLQPS